MQDWEMTEEQIREKINNMVWSFSRVNSSSCLYSFYLQYIEGMDKDELAENAYAQFGTVCHQTLEKFLKGELTIFDVADYYEQQYPEIVTCDFPANKYKDLGEAAYMAGLEYFQNLNFDFDKYEILGVEKEYLFDVGPYHFKGFVDALYRDKETGEIIIRDHKTSSFKYLKDGSISKTNREVFDHYKKQELLYSIPVMEEYGRVDWLTWNMIRDGKIIKIPFNEEELNETKEWAISQIQKLEQELLWLPDTSNSYFCNTLCSARGHCFYRQGA